MALSFIWSPIANMGIICQVEFYFFFNFYWKVESPSEKPVTQKGFKVFYAVQEAAAAAVRHKFKLVCVESFLLEVDPIEDIFL